MTNRFTHIDAKGHVRMVDVTNKPTSLRKATAKATVSMHQDTFAKLIAGTLKKGNVLETARIAGIMAAKKTANLIPMCHPLIISHAAVNFFPDKTQHKIRIEASIQLQGQTGVEMEALTAAAISALTIYDMCKSLDREMTISNICVLHKSGGKSGVYVREEAPN